MTTAAHPSAVTSPLAQAASVLPFLAAALLVIVLVSTDQYSSAVLPMSFWSKLGMAEFPYRMTALALVVTALATPAFLIARRAPDAYVFLTVLTLVALQTNGIRVGGVDLIFMMPFIVILFMLAESLRQPGFQIALPGVMFFGMLLIVLDLPYFAAGHIYSPGRFTINFISMVKGIMVAFIFVNLVRTERQLAITLRAFLIVAFISALIGVGQIALQYLFGITVNFASEQAEWKPNFLGMTLRATGLTTWPSWLSDFLVLALPIMLFRLFNAETLRWRAIYLVGILVMLAAIIFTLTYAAWLAVALIFAVFPFLYWPRKSIHLILAVLMASVILHVSGGFEWGYDHVSRKIVQSSGMIERNIYLQSTLHELVRDPWVGSGLYAEEEFSENSYRKRVHNTGLQAWAALGLPGLLVFLTMMLSILAQLWLMAKAFRGTDRQLFQALGLGVAAMILEMFAEPNLTVPIAWFFLGLCQAALLVYCTWRYPRPVSGAFAPGGIATRVTGT